MPLYVYATATLVAAAVAVAVATALAERQPKDDSARRNLARSVGGVPQNSRQVQLAGSARDRLLDPLFAAIARRARRLSSAKGVGRTARKLNLAGLTEAGWTVERMLVIRALSAGTALGVAALLVSNDPSRNTWLQAILVMVMGTLGPKAWLDRKANERQEELADMLPDLIDQISVNLEAGLGFDLAVIRATEGSDSALSEEFRRVQQDVQMGATREAAFERMAEVTDVADIRQLVSSIRQSAKHGISISSVLKVQSSEIRRKQQDRIEEKAAQLPVKIVFPLVFCILPSLFVIVLGPAALDVAGGF